MNSLISILAFSIGAAIALVADILPAWLRLPLALILLGFAFSAICQASPSVRPWLHDIFSPWKRGAIYQRLTAAPFSWSRDHRLYDWALRLAVLYPILSAVAPWILFGHAVTLGGAPGSGGVEILGATENEILQLALFCAIALAANAPLLGNAAAASRKVFLRKVSGWLPLIAVAVAFAFAVAVAVADTAAGAIAVAAAVAVAGAGAGAAAIAVTVAIAVAAAAAVAVAGAVAVAAAAAVVVAVAAAVAGAGAGAVQGASDNGWGRSAYLALTLGLLTALATAVTGISWENVPPTGRVIFLFLGLLPLVNAIFDYMSYSVTLTLLRWGHTRPGWGLVAAGCDLIAALLLFFLSGAGLVLAVALANDLAGTALYPLSRTLADLGDWRSYWWVYAMAFSTILPTLAHFAVACFSATAWFLPGWRTWVLAHLDTDDPTELMELLALMTAFFLGSVLLPVAFLVLLATMAQAILPGYLGVYLGWLHDINCWIDPAACPVPI